MRVELTSYQGYNDNGEKYDFLSLYREEPDNPLTYGAYDACGWYVELKDLRKEIADHIKFQEKEFKVILSDSLNRYISGEDITGSIVAYYVRELIEAIEAEYLPLVPFYELHDYCDANVLLDDVLGNPYENDGLDTSVYWGNLVSEAYDRTLQP